ncbi:Retinol dehydrogenase 7 [Aphelenchoides fujianensis]|nr:Retinol dehydrogenase 7 [Aphelenchoides fujianensis]
MFPFDLPWLPIVVTVAIGYWLLKRILERLQVDDLEHKAVFITGCDSGFGRETALKLSRMGIPVYAGCLTEEGLHSIEKEAEEQRLPARLVGIPLDVTKDESVNEAVRLVREDLPKGTKLWALLNNAGVFTTCGPAEWCSIDEYKWGMDINFYGVVRCTQAFLPLIKQSKGRIAATSSVAGRIGTPGAAPYSAAKFAVAAYMECLFTELKSFGIHCGVFHPGIFKTPLLDEEAKNKRVEFAWQKMAPELREEYGEEFKASFLKHWHQTMNNIGSTCTYRVTDAYIQFVTSRYPRFRYVVGLDALFFWIPMSWLPAEWSRPLWQIESTAKPAAVLQGKYD